MLSRCYNKNNQYYRLYGGAGVTVDNRWHNFYNFYNDIQTLDGWNKDDFLNKKITLDKDKLQQKSDKKVYSKDTCCWLSIIEQNSLIDFVSAHENEMTKFLAIFPNGDKIIYSGVKRFCREYSKYNLIPQSIISCINGEQSQHKGFKFSKV